MAMTASPQDVPLDCCMTGTGKFKGSSWSCEIEYRPRTSVKPASNNPATQIKPMIRKWT
jgi:hypothetical protein